VRTGVGVDADLGIATAQPDQSFEDAFRQADQALYLAKSRGLATTDDQLGVTGSRIVNRVPVPTMLWTSNAPP
jgi:GGDEF domain-containing protein